MSASACIFRVHPAPCAYIGILYIGFVLYTKILNVKEIKLARETSLLTVDMTASLLGTYNPERKIQSSAEIRIFFPFYFLETSIFIQGCT